MYINQQLKSMEIIGERNTSEPWHWYILYSITRNVNPNKVVETGVYKAGSTIAIAQALKDNGRENPKMFSFDMWEFGTKDEAIKNIEKAGLRDLIELTDGETKDTLSEKMKEIGEIELAFIDGLHSYDGVKYDFDCIYPFLKTNGVIILHDTVNCKGVIKFMNELQQKYGTITNLVSFDRPDVQNRGIALFYKKG